MINYGKIFFGAIGGDVANVKDLQIVDGVITPLPVECTNFKVTAATNAALVQCTTSQEMYSRDFTIQCNNDVVHFE